MAEKGKVYPVVISFSLLIFLSSSSNHCPLKTGLSVNVLPYHTNRPVHTPLMHNISVTKPFPLPYYIALADCNYKVMVATYPTDLFTKHLFPSGFLSMKSMAKFIVSLNTQSLHKMSPLRKMKILLRNIFDRKVGRVLVDLKLAPASAIHDEKLPLPLG